MAIINFKLGIAGKEATFTVNPTKMDWEPLRLADTGRAGDGSLIDLTISSNRPTFRLQGNYISPDMLNQLHALMSVDDQYLIFEPVDFTAGQVWEVWTKRVIPNSPTTIALPPSSMVTADRLRAAASASATISVVGLWSGANATSGRVGTGTEYMAANSGTLNHTTGVITLATPLSTLAAVYLTYQYKAFAVALHRVPSTIEGGWVNTWRYESIELVGV